jgi:hypothetical protein
MLVCLIVLKCDSWVYEKFYSNKKHIIGGGSSNSSDPLVIITSSRVTATAARKGAQNSRTSHCTVGNGPWRHPVRTYVRTEDGMSGEVTAKRVWLRFHLPSEVPRVGRVTSVLEAVGQAAWYTMTSGESSGGDGSHWQRVCQGTFRGLQYRYYQYEYQSAIILPLNLQWITK